jgi:hypothetical protein
MHAEICPICNGEGRIKRTKDQTAEGYQRCHGCDGKGWVEVQDIYLHISPEPDYDPYPGYTWFGTGGTRPAPNHTPITVWC